MVAGQNTVQGRSSSGYRVGSFLLDIERKELSKNGSTVKLRPQSFDALIYLVENPGRVVSKQTLMRKIWGDKAVSEDSLTHCIIDIRKALGDVDKRFVRTLPRRGFVLELPVERVASHAVTRTLWRQPLRYSGFMAIGLLAIVVALAAFHFGARTNDTASRPSLSTDYGAEALDYYLQARFLFHRRAPGDLRSARELYLNAIRHEPDFADAWAGLAGTYAIEYMAGGYKKDGLLEQQRHAAEEAIAIDTTLAEGLVRLSGYYRAIGEDRIADDYLDRAYANNPDDTLLLSVMAGRYAHDGDLELAIELQQRAVTGNPLSLVNRRNLAFYLFASGRYDEAMSENRRVLQLSPTTLSSPNLLDGWALIQLERYKEAHTVVQGWPESEAKHAAMAMVLLKLGNKGLANAEMMKLRDSGELESYVRLAELFAFCGELDRSFAALGDLYSEVGHDKLALSRHGLLDDIRLSPFLAPLRTDPRWNLWGNNGSLASVQKPGQLPKAQ